MWESSHTKLWGIFHIPTVVDHVFACQSSHPFLVLALPFLCSADVRKTLATAFLRLLFHWLPVHLVHRLEGKREKESRIFHFLSHPRM
jgi:hypothetical protein